MVHLAGNCSRYGSRFCVMGERCSRSARTLKTVETFSRQEPLNGGRSVAKKKAAKKKAAPKKATKKKAAKKK